MRDNFDSCRYQNGIFTFPNKVGIRVYMFTIPSITILFITAFYHYKTLSLIINVHKVNIK